MGGSMLSWAWSPLQGAPLRHRAEPEGPSHPPASLAAVAPAAPEGTGRAPPKRAPRSVDGDRAGCVLETQQTLVRFLHLVHVLHDLGAASPWLMVSPRVLGYVTAASGSLFGR
jgi:hypothetical protein